MVAIGWVEKKTVQAPSVEVGLSATRLPLKALPTGKVLPRKDIRPLTSTARWSLSCVTRQGPFSILPNTTLLEARGVLEEGVIGITGRPPTSQKWYCLSSS